MKLHNALRFCNKLDFQEDKVHLTGNFWTFMESSRSCVNFYNNRKPPAFQMPNYLLWYLFKISYTYSFLKRNSYKNSGTIVTHPFIVASFSNSAGHQRLWQSKITNILSNFRDPIWNVRDCCPLRHTNIEFKRSKGMVQSQNLLLKAILATNHKLLFSGMV